MLTIPELPTAWSAGGAYNLYQEDGPGTLEEGKKADIVVFNRNSFKTPQSLILWRIFYSLSFLSMLK